MTLLKEFLISPNIKKFNKFSPKLNIAVLASGEGSNFQVLIDLSKNKKLDINIKMLITNNENAGCIKKAINANIPYFIINQTIYKTKRDFENEIIKKLSTTEIELIVMAGWMRIVTPEFVTRYKQRIINIHPSILPSYKGSKPILDALNNGSLITGCSVHFVVPEVDSGKLLIQAAMPIDKKDDFLSIKNKIHCLEHIILPYGISEAGDIIRRS